MDWTRTRADERAALKRIVALLFALADLAELACARSRSVRGFVLWLLLPAEALARHLITGAPAPIPHLPSRDSAADAMRLAEDFRALARELGRQATLAFTVDRIGQDEASRPVARRALAGFLSLIDALAIPASARDTLRLASLPDTS